jgi:hypothetical protein
MPEQPRLDRAIGAGADTSPEAWCRETLAFLEQETAATDSVPYREMVLAYIIQRDPSPADFEALLAKWAVGATGEIGEAAALLRAAWLRAQAVTSPLEHLGRSELLRTLGGLLDNSSAHAARLVVTKEAVELQVFHDSSEADAGGVHEMEMPLEELRHLSAARMAALRGRAPDRDPTRAERFETRLRMVGLQLESLPDVTYEVIVVPWLVTVHASTGETWTFTADELATLLRTAPHTRQLELK